MALYQRDSENADRDLTSQVTVLTDTVDISGRYVVRLMLGDGTKDLDGTGGDFELTITVDGNTVQPDPQTITFSTAVRSVVESHEFTALSGEQVIAKVKSPNAADTDVDCTSILMDVTRALPAVAPDSSGGLATEDANGRLSADVTAVSGDSTAADNLESDYDGTGYNKTNSTIGTTTTNTDMRGTDSALLAASVNTAGGVVESNLVQVAGSATVDAVPIATWAARIFQALIRPFTGNFAARTKAFQDSAGATAFTHTYTNDGNNSRSLS